jgi:cystathionine beta-synthase
MEDRKLIGLMDEADVLLRVTGDAGGFATPVGTVMRREFETVDVNTPIDDIIPKFESSRAVCVMDKGEFLGLITPADFLNYLRKRTGRA